MRKLAWAVIIFLVIFGVIAGTCAIYPPASTTVYDVGVNIVGQSIVNGVTAGMTGMMSWGASGLGPAVAVFLGTGIVFTVLWLVILRKYVWTPVRNLRSPTVTKTYQNQPVVTQPTPVVKVESKPQKVEEKEEVVVEETT